jgi:phosphoribosylformylglycinamidine cyclo-ligase
VDVARARGTTLLRAGAVETGPRRVVIEPLGLVFAGDSLEIR